MTGANAPDEHLSRRRSPDATSRSARSTCAASARATPSTDRRSRSSRAIEVGNIFKLGTRYSEPLGRALPGRQRAWSSRSGWAPTGSARRASSPRPSSSSPTSTASPGRARWRRSPCTSSRSASPARPSATPPTRCMRRSRAGGVEVLYDDREAGTGEKFADAELLGCPLRLTVGRRSLESGEAEVQLRRDRQEARRPVADGRARAAPAGSGRAVAEPP